MARLFYTVIFYLCLPLIAVKLLWRSRKAPAYRRRWGERLGFVAHLQKPESGQILWLHSVSVGETLAAVPLVKALQNQYPNAQIVVTTMTPTGSDRAVASFGDSVYHCYAPYDLPDAQARFHRRIQPDLLVIMETELWPNMIAACHQRGVPVVLANARLSQRSADGYDRVSALSKPMLAQLTTIAAQHQDDARRFVEIGAAPERVQVTGNIKFDLDLDASLHSKAEQLRAVWSANGARPVLLVASTHSGEDEPVIEAFASLRREFENLLLVLVPRHPERFNDVYALCSERFATARRSQHQQPSGDTAIVLGDTMGELASFFGACDIAVIGGSLVPVGGHNMIEAAAWGVPVVTGPHLFNFAEATRLMTDADAMQIVQNGDELADALAALLRNPERRRTMGISGRQVAEANRGALDRLLGLIANRLIQ